MSDKWKMENPWKEKWFVFLRKETDQKFFYCKRFVLTSVTTSPTFTNHRRFLIFFMFYFNKYIYWNCKDENLIWEIHIVVFANFKGHFTIYFLESQQLWIANYYTEETYFFIPLEKYTKANEEKSKFPK